MKAIVLSLLAFGTVASLAIALPSLAPDSSVLIGCRLPSDPPPKDPLGSV